jgi:predicted Zn-dependent protease
MRQALHNQSYAMRAGVFPTNVVLRSSDTMALDALLASITDGVYIGGLGATTPQGSLRHGELTSTIIGPSFHIRQGKLDRPLRDGTLRLQVNLCDLLQEITGFSTAKRQVALPTLQSLVLTPEVRCRRLRLVG